MGKDKGKKVGKPMGRPTVYNSDYCQLVIDLAMRGYPFETMAIEAQCCIKTLYVWLDKHPDFLQAKQTADAIRTGVLQRRFIDGSFKMNGMELNPVPAVLSVKNFGNMKDVSHNVHKDISDTIPRLQDSEVLDLAKTFIASREKPKKKGK